MAELRASGMIRSERVAQAFADVERERFVPSLRAEQGLEALYRDEAYVTKRDGRGLPLSSSSQPGLMAAMLELLDVRPGDRALEIGAGTGQRRAPRAPCRRVLEGVTGMDSVRPPLLLIYLLLSIPDSRRVSVRHDGRLGIGTIDRRSGTIAVVSVRSPWMGDASKRNARARWRLDAYGGDGAAPELIRLLDGWRVLQRERHAARLEVTADGHGDALSVSFSWTPG